MAGGHGEPKVMAAPRDAPQRQQQVEQQQEQEEEEEQVAEFEVELTDAQTWAVNFYECAAEGDRECLEEILDSGKVGVDAVDVDGFSALMIAAAEGHAQVVRALLDRGADTAVRTHELRSTALHFAAKHGDADIVEAICAKTESVDCWNANEDTPLIWACIEGRLEAARVLLAHGADVKAVNHYGAPPLLCAVMIGENPDEDDSDHNRSEIVKLLLEKDRALVNFQDREGSTAMHLAASCGYLECVKTLLSYGADITLRNAIGQTPLEEAEQSGLSGSEKCVAHLRVVWRQLEEEAASRMLAMLELEESATCTSETNRTGSKKSKKKHKHKNGKRKSGAPKSAALDAVNSNNSHETTEDTSRLSAVEATEEDSDEDGDDNDGKKHAAESKNNVVNESLDEDSKHNSEHSPSQNDSTNNAESTLASAGVWTTVGRKHRGGSVPASSSADSELHRHNQKSPPKKNATHQRVQPPRQPRVAVPSASLPISKATASTPTPPTVASSIAASVQPGLSTPGLGRRDKAAPWSKPIDAEANLTSSTPPAPAANSASVDEQILSSVPPSSHTNIGQVSSALWHTPIQPTILTGTIGLPTSSSSFMSASRSQYSAPVSMSAPLTASRLIWRQGHHPSHYYHYQQHHQYPTRVGMYGPPMTAQDATARWIGKLDLGNPTVADTMALLACGLCGELVDDNLQCSSGAGGGDSSSRICTQLYCSLCVLRMGASSERFTCVKCRQEVSRASMRRNEFAQQQAASIALSIRHGQDNGNLTTHANSSSHGSSLSGADIQRALFRAVPRAEAVDLRACDLVPGVADLAAMSNGQLEVLDEAHAAARQTIVDQMVANARSVEREQMLEWLKLHRVSYPSLSSSGTDLWRPQQ